MKLAPTLAAIAVIAGTLGAAPAFSDPGRGNGKGHQARHDEHRGDHRKPRPQARYIADCPPGLAKKNPPCVPPGQARKHVARYGNRVGDILRTKDYIVVRDPRRYDLEARHGWNYYRDDDRIYRVDSETRKVLAVLNLIDAFAN
ncbi:hypothetical protein JWJ88_03535 [Paracoccus methylovorus]|uniref:Excinuclease ABC subunit A n=1 Tax=Paracoccus methylovorus TaxID=2812658 RepID=A0ABX7JFL9_9RHOB|nr:MULTISPECIES: hypothetical protein [Paracoccus]QRZ12681.1 hypothetical protein JWJ88_08665 [Paracoccus methylovorus]QRZ13749.1 hypothetical protein JWJ88_03535 [Paracoccus methylovorus]